MGDDDGNDDSNDDRGVSARRRFVARLDEHGGVTGLDFTRDGFRTVFVEAASDADTDEWRRTAERLGYTVEPPGSDAHRAWRLEEWWEGSHEAVRVLRLDPERDPRRYLG